MRSVAASRGTSSTTVAAICLQTGSKASMRSGVKYRSFTRRYSVCSGGSMPFGTVSRGETALLNVSGSCSTRVTSSCRRTDQPR